MSSVTVAFEPTRDELLQAMRWGRRQQVPADRPIAIGVLCMALGVVLVIVGWGIAGWVWFAAGLVFFPGWFLIEWFQMRGSVDRNPVTRQRMEWTVSDQGLDILTEDGSSHHEWSRFDGRTEKGDLVFLHIRGTRSGAYVIPRRAFPSHSVLDAFLDLIDEHIEATWVPRSARLGAVESA
jgi:YcxB-like protein